MKRQEVEEDQATPSLLVKPMPDSVFMAIE